MIHILPYSLWLGHAGDGRDVAGILATGIESVVQLAVEEPPVHYPREIIYLRVPLLDGSDNPPATLRLAIDVVERLVTAKRATLVCCGAGLSRSPAVAACALSHIEGRSPQSLLEQIQQAHGTDVLPTFWCDLMAALEPNGH